jgi:hypothetical protein
MSSDTSGGGGGGCAVQFIIGVVKSRGEARIAHIENSVMDSSSVTVHASTSLVEQVQNGHARSRPHGMYRDARHPVAPTDRWGVPGFCRNLTLDQCLHRDHRPQESEFGRAATAAHRGVPGPPILNSLNEGLLPVSWLVRQRQIAHLSRLVSSGFWWAGEVITRTCLQHVQIVPSPGCTRRLSGDFHGRCDALLDSMSRLAPQPRVILRDTPGLSETVDPLMVSHSGGQHPSAHVEADVPT